MTSTRLWLHLKIEQPETKLAKCCFLTLVNKANISSPDIALAIGQAKISVWETGMNLTLGEMSLTKYVMYV